MALVPFANYDPATGRYTRASWCDADSADLVQPNTYQGRVDINVQYHDLATDQPAFMPPKPGQFYDFDYAAKQWTFNSVAAWTQVRVERDARLRASDWTQLSDIPLTATQITQWRTYRQALRDVTTQPDPLNIVWPTPPA